MAVRHAGAIGLALALMLVFAAPGRTAGATCDCSRFADQLTAARALYRSRGEGATLNPTDAMRQRFRERVLETWDRALCLVGCPALSDRDRDEARGFLGMVGFKSRSLGPTDAAARARV